MAAQLTRLETRTKEFNMHASCWDFKPASAVKASQGFALNWRDPVIWRKSDPAHRRPITSSRGCGGG